MAFWVVGVVGVAGVETATVIGGWMVGSMGAAVVTVGTVGADPDGELTGGRVAVGFSMPQSFS